MSILRKIFRRISNILIKIIKYVPFNWAIYLRYYLYKFSFNTIGKKVYITDSVTINNPHNINIGNRVSIHEYSYFEGFGIPILEALFCKTVVITSKDGCFTEAGGPNTKYINPLSIQEMKEAISEILNSSDLQKEMRTKGFEYAQNFTDDKIATNLIKVYKEI